MRLFLAAGALFVNLAAVAAPPPLHNPPDLRRVLRQDLEAAAPQAPRHLNPEQRAELRRQLGDFHPAPRRTP